MSFINLRFLNSVAALGLVCASHAAITYYDVYHIDDYVQTAASTVSHQGVFLSADIETDTPGEATAGTVTDPSSAVYALTPVSPTTLNYKTGYFADESSLESTYPNGTYTFETNATSATLTAGPFVYADHVGMLDDASYASLQGLDSSSALALNWGGWNPQGAGPNTEVTFFSIYDLTDGTVAYSSYGDANSFTGMTLAGGSLAANHQFEWDLYFSSRDEIANAGFGGATSIASTDYHTSGQFATTPEPATLGFLATGLAALLRRRRGR